MSSLLAGELAPVASVAKKRTGLRPSPATIWRWLRKGVCNGTVRLEAVCHGGKWLTTPAAFEKFLTDQTAHALGNAVSDKSSESDDSDAALLAAGLL